MEPEAALARLRPYIDALEERLDAFQSLMLERHGDLSDEYDEAKRFYKIAAGLHVEMTRLDNDLGSVVELEPAIEGTATEIEP